VLSPTEIRRTTTGAPEPDGYSDGGPPVRSSVGAAATVRARSAMPLPWRPWSSRPSTSLLTPQRATAWHSTRVNSREVEGRPSPPTPTPPRHGRRSWPCAGIPYSRVDLGTVGSGIELRKAGSLPTDVETSASRYLLCEHADADSQRAANRSALPSVAGTPKLDLFDTSVARAYRNRIGSLHLRHRSSSSAALLLQRSQHRLCLGNH